MKINEEAGLLLENVLEIKIFNHPKQGACPFKSEVEVPLSESVGNYLALIEDSWYEHWW